MSSERTEETVKGIAWDIVVMNNHGNPGLLDCERTAFSQDAEPSLMAVGAALVERDAIISSSFGLALGLLVTFYDEFLKEA